MNVNRLAEKNEENFGEKLETVVEIRLCRVFGIILAYFYSKFVGQYTEIDIAQRIWSKNGLKRTQKSTEA